MRPYGIVELVKSGRVALARDLKGGQRTLRATG
jgi:acetolactate synthase small subunit